MAWCRIGDKLLWTNDGLFQKRDFKLLTDWHRVRPKRSGLGLCFYPVLVWYRHLIPVEFTHIRHTWNKYAHPHDHVIKWKYFPRYWAFARGIHRSPMNSPHKGQWRGTLMFPLICALINVWSNNREVGNLRRHWAHYDVTVMGLCFHRALVWYHHLIPVGFAHIRHTYNKYAILSLGFVVVVLQVLVHIASPVFMRVKPKRKCLHFTHAQS